MMYDTPEAILGREQQMLGRRIRAVNAQSTAFKAHMLTTVVYSYEMSVGTPDEETRYRVAVYADGHPLWSGVVPEAES